MNIKTGNLLKRGAACAAVAALLAQASHRAEAGELAAVISAPSDPYNEALAGFKAALDLPFESYDASKPGFAPPEDLRYVAAFGVRAAALDYPPGTHLVYAMAPIAARGAGWHEISMLPEPAEAMAAYQALQPSLKRLAVFWSKYPDDRYLDELAKAGAARGITVISTKIKDPDFFPERLRYLMGKMDAFWLMPDPALINKSSLMVLANFSCANSIPFYAPTYALVQDGASASFSADFAESGAAAARAISTIHNGGEQPRVAYPEKPAMRVNTALADKCSWPFKKYVPFSSPNKKAP